MIRKLLSVLLLVSVLSFPVPILSAPPPVSITSFPQEFSANCAEYIAPYPVDDGYSGCESINYYGDWAVGGASGTWRIISDANYPSGGGGRGVRQWYGPSNNNNSSNTWFNLSTRPSDLWIRYYARWQAGFNAKNSNGTTGLWQKMIYAYNTNAVPSVVISVRRGNTCVMEGYSPNFTTYAYGCGANQLGFDNVTELNNGQWNLIEFHFQIGNPGVIEFWINGVKAAEKLDWYQAGFTGIQRILLPSNNHTLDIPGAMYYDEDDFAFSTTGRIGPYGGTPPPPPTPAPGDPLPPDLQNISPGEEKQFFRRESRIWPLN